MVSSLDERFYQEFQDFVKYNTSSLEEIKTQVKKTNGRVNRHDTELALLTNNYIHCPARELAKIPNKAALKANKISVLALFVVILQVAFSLINHFL